MHLRADYARDRFIGRIVIGHFLSGPALYSLAGCGTAIKKSRRHQTRVAQTKRRPRLIWGRLKLREVTASSQSFYSGSAVVNNGAVRSR